MSPKRSASSKPSGNGSKRQRKMLTIVEKVKLLDMLKEGRSYAAVGRHYGINESSVRYIKKDEKNIRSTALLTFNKTAKRIVTPRNKAIVRMESELSLWISDCKNNNIRLDTNTIREKARQLFGKFTDSGDDDPQQGTSTASLTKPTEFTASKGWFDKFQRRFNLKKSVSPPSETASADKPATEEYVNDTFKTLIEEGGYSHEQGFDMFIGMSLKHFVGGNGPTREHPDPLPVRPMNMLQSTAGYAEAGPSNQGYSGKPENSRRKKIATATVSSETVLIPDDSPPQPTAPKLQKKQLDDRRFDERRFDEQRFQERRFENRRFEERRQMAAAAQSAQVAAPQMQVPSQMQVQQHLQVSAPPPAPVQVAPRQVQVLAPPVQVTVAKPKPVEKPRPREKRIFVVADHQRCVMSNLASLWKSGKLCDAGIGNGSSTVMVHKVVLSAVCPKLLSVFSTDILSHKFLQVNFPEEVSTEALNAFAEYMYNGILDLDRDILEQLKIIAKRLDMKEFEQLCDSHLPNHMHQPASAAVASFSNVPLIQTTMQIPPMTSSLPSLGSTISTSMHSAPSITTQVIDVKQEISEAELAQVKKDTAAVFGQESEVSSLAPNKSGNAAGFVISPSIKTEPVGPEDDKYGHLGSSNQAFTSTASSSSVVPTAASTSIASVPASSTEFAIPFSEATDVKSTRLKVTHSYDPPLVSDLSPVSCIVETVCSQSSPMNEDSSKPLNRLAVSTSSTDGLTTSTGNGGVYPVGLFTAGGDNLPLLTTQTVGIKTIDLYKTDLT